MDMESVLLPLRGGGWGAGLQGAGGWGAGARKGLVPWLVLVPHSPGAAHRGVGLKGWQSASASAPVLTQFSIQNIKSELRCLIDTESRHSML